MAEEQLQSLEVKEMVVGDISTLAAVTPKTGTLGMSSANLLVYNGTNWIQCDN